jgi:hypothetical protein
MNGELTVEETPGGGATFVFSLPRAVPGAGRPHDEPGTGTGGIGYPRLLAR